MEGLVGSSPAIQALRANIRRLTSRTQGLSRPPAILIQGETGTGKGLVASLLHRMGPRAAGPFVDVNCAAIPETLIEAELFGYERGAFTDARRSKPGLFQTAHRGTLFLDEIGLLPEALQAKLLKAIEERAVRRLGATHTEPVDTWVVSATNADLATAVKQHRFREDLYHRLAVVTIALSPLRTLGDDIILLAEHYLARACADYGLPARVLAADARDRLLTYRWPGNIRELANTMERAALLAETPEVTAAMLDLSESAGATASGPRSSRLDQAMRGHVQAVLDQTAGNISQSAAILGITRNTLRSHIQKLGLRRVGGSPRGEGRAVASPASEEEPLAERGEGALAEIAAAPEGEAPSAGPPAVVSIRWQRRLVTFLGFELAGPEETSSFQFAPLLGHLVGKLRSFGARVEELTPDRLVAAFGFDPVEDAPTRAAHAALAMLKELERPDGGSMSHVTGRFAIHVRRCLVAQSGDVAGMDGLDRRAAWGALDALIGQAPPQTVMVDVSGARFLERRFELQVAEIAGRGDAVYRVVGHERSGFEVGGVARSRFVGRARELAALREFLTRAEGGYGQVVGILGEPGVGKSRLLHEFKESLESGRATYLEGRCLSYGSTIPYLPIIDIVRANFQLLETDAPDAIVTKVQSGVEALGLAPAASVPYLLHLLGSKEGTERVGNLSPDAIKARTMDVLRQMGIAGSRQRPIVFAVEDLQWIDQTSEEALASLAESLARCPIVLVATYRPGYRPRWLGRSYASQLGLDPLTPADSLAVVHSVIPEREIAPELAEVIVNRADGVPFFLEELARAVADHPDLRSNVMVPDTIQGVLEARLDRLPEAEKHLLQVASVVGKDVLVPLLQAVADVPDPDLRHALSRLQGTEFLVLKGLSPVHEYTFKHALTHEAAYRSLLEERRRALHARAAETIEALYPGTRERQPELLARHYTHADLRPQAIACWQLAGQRAIRRSASAEAIAHLQRGLELLATLPDTPARAPQELVLCLALGQAQVMARGYAAPEVERTLQRARELCQQVGESPQIFPALFGLWRFYQARANFPAAHDLARQLLAVAERQGDPMLLTAAHVASALPPFYRGELAAARAHLEQALSSYRPEHSAIQTVVYGQDLCVGALLYLGWTLGLLGYRDQAAETADRAVALARTTSHPFTLALALLLAGWVRHLRGEVVLIGQIGEEELVLSREQAFPFFLAGGLGFTGAALVARGETERGLELMREGARVYRSTGMQVGLVHLAHLGRVLLDTGHADEALVVVGDALARSHESGERVYRAELYRIKGEALLRRADPDPGAAAVCFRDAIGLARQQGARVFELRATTSLARLEPHGATARAELASCGAWFTEGADLADQQEAQALLAELSCPPPPAEASR